MPVVEQVPMSRTTITIIALVLLCAAVVAYSQGWFNWSSRDYEAQSNSVSANQALGDEDTNRDAVPVARETAEVAETATK